MAEYSRRSPYFQTDQSKGYLDVAEFVDIPTLQDDVLWAVTAQYKNRPDLLAYDLYKDSNLWWVFAVRNKDVLRDPIYDMIPGQQIYIPQIATIKKVLGL
jgi:hypothetical protein